MVTDDFFNGSVGSSFISGSKSGDSSNKFFQIDFIWESDGDLALAGNVETVKTGQRIELNASSNQLFFYNSKW